MFAFLARRLHINTRTMTITLSLPVLARRAGGGWDIAVWDVLFAARSSALA